MKQQGIVTEFTARLMTIELLPTAACVECNSGRGCGAGLFARLFLRTAKPVQINIAAINDARVGDRVSVELSDRWLVRKALTGFFLPMLLLVAVLVGGHWAAQSLGLRADAGAILAGLCALLVCAGWRSRLQTRSSQRSGNGADEAIADLSALSSGTVIARTEVVSKPLLNHTEHRRQGR